MMEGWKEVKLGDVLDKIIGGGTPSKNNQSYWHGNIPWCSVKDMSDDKFIVSNTEDSITDVGLNNSSANLISKGTVVTATRMGLGRAFITGCDMAINQDLKALIPNSKIDNKFLLWLIIVNRENLDNLGTGSTVKGIRLETLRGIKINLPPPPTQRKIASILSAYDDLIENNLKRIKLLEEKAQLTYEEWFVRMKFPRHETTPINKETGLPEGWELVKVGALLAKLKSTKKIKSSEILESGSTPVIDQSRDFIKGYTNEPDALIDIDEPIIVFGDHTRILKFIDFNFARGADGTQLALSKDPRMPQHLFYQVLKGIDLSDYHYARHFKYLKDTEINICDEITANHYEDFAAPLFKAIKQMRDQNKLLKEARDILLPRLMTGIIDVEQMNIETLQPTTA